MTAEAEALRVQRDAAELARKLHPREVLAVQMQPNEAGAATIRDYLVSLLARVWDLDEQFSGKRPFGDSGWKVDVAEALVRAEVVAGTWDSDEDEPDEKWLEDWDRDAAHRLIATAIEALRHG